MPIPAGSTPLAPPTSGPLVYDSVLSRVRINLSGLRATDAFGRTVPAWGPALNANPYFETNTSGWTTQGSTATISRSTVRAHEGAASMRIVPDGISASGGAIAASGFRAPVTAGLVYRVSFWAYADQAMTVGPGVEWWDALSGGSVLGSNFDQYAIPAGVWTFMESTFTAPVGATHAAARARHGGSAWTTGHVWYVDEATVQAEAGGWGTADTGQVWSVTDGAAAQHSVNGSAAQHSVNALNTLFRDRLPVDYADIDLLVLARVGSAPTGAYLRHQVDFRAVDALNYYCARAHIQPGGAIDLILVRVAGGVETTLQAVGTGQTHVAGTALVFNIQTRGSQLRASVWRDGTSPPLNWQANVTDSTHKSGAVALATLLPPGNTNTQPLAVTYDSLTVTPTVNVERSTDQIRWTTVRGGFEMVPDAGNLRLDDYEFTADVTNWYRLGPLFSGSILPVLGGVWLKSLSRPFLNRQVTVRDFSDVTRPARSGVFDVKGRSFPVAVTDVRGSQQWSIDVNTYTEQERSDLDLLLASGDILLVHVPTGAGRISATPGGYVLVGDSREATPPTHDLAMRVISMPCRAVAAPGPDVVGATVTCQSVLNLYATCQAVLDAHPTCLSVMELIGDPTDVIVP